MPIQRYKMTIAYDGSDFCGWQVQNNPLAPPLRTVQGVVHEAVMRTIDQPTFVQGASRTDSGVHALGQVGHFDADTRIPPDKLAKAINSRLPEDVEILSVEPVAADFDACRGAVEKQYRYRIWNSSRRPLHVRRLVYNNWVPLEISLMRDAAARLVGEHDFAGFAAAGHNRLTTVRTIFGCEVQELRGEPPLHAEEVHIVVRGSGFLYNMVRIIAGTLLDVGRGRLPLEQVDRAIAEAKRELAGPTLPPQGLYLEWIRYGEGSPPPYPVEAGAESPLDQMPE